MNRLRRTQASTAHTTGVTGSGVEGDGARNGLRMLVTMPLRNPTRPVAGVATWAVGTTGAIAAASAEVVSAPLAVLVLNACAVGAALDSVTLVDGFATIPWTSTTPTEVGVVAALTVAECVEFDSVLAGVDAGCSVSGAGVAGGVIA